MKELCFASNNRHKLEEISRLLPHLNILTLAELGCTEELPETQDTIAGNSRQKALYVAEKFGIPCFADDSGLEVHALNGAPGVHSAYYGGPERDAQKNMARLLEELNGLADRSARFITVITLEGAGPVQTFEGILEGSIIPAARGTSGFGYDPIFLPRNCDRTLAQMSMEEKNAISHRFKAVSALARFLQTVQW
ncbi:MAG: RdgB/HAM1 family non-canonical purine NTP pyrophosphatase [Bacteroidota bacterium]